MAKVTLGSSTEFAAACSAGDAVGDCVYVSGGLFGGLPQVAKADISTFTKLPAVGIISRKLNPTVCFVANSGALTLPFAVTPGKLYFVGALGQPVDTRPAGPAFIQTIGVGRDAANLLVTPSNNIVKVIAP